MNFHNKTSFLDCVIGALAALALLTLIILAIALIDRPEVVFQLVSDALGE